MDFPGISFLFILKYLHYRLNHFHIHQLQIRSGVVGKDNVAINQINAKYWADGTVGNARADQREAELFFF